MKNHPHSLQVTATLTVSLTAVLASSGLLVPVASASASASASAPQKSTASKAGQAKATPKKAKAASATPPSKTGSAKPNASAPARPVSQPQSKPAPAIVTEANDAQLKELRSRLFKAELAAVNLQKQLARYPVFRLNGSVESGDETRIEVYGKAIGSVDTPFGWLREDSFYDVLDPYPQDLRAGKFLGIYLFLHAKNRRNVYTRPPQAYHQLVAALTAQNEAITTLRQAVDRRVADIKDAQYQRKRQQAEAEQRRLDEKAKAEAARLAALEAQRKDGVTAEVERFLTNAVAQEPKTPDPTFLQKSADESLAFYQRLRPQDEHPVLLERYVVQLTRLADLQAQAGDLGAASETLAKAFWADVPAAESNLLLRDSFSNAAVAAYRKNPAALQSVLETWAVALPEYVKKAGYGESLRIKRFSAIMLGCVSAYPAINASQQKLLTAYNIAYESAQINTNNPGDRGNKSTTTNPTQTASPAPQTQRPPALNFYFGAAKYTRTNQDLKRFQLKDFKGKVVVLMLWDGDAEDRAESPTPIEQFCAIAKKYDPNKVAFLPISNLANKPAVAEYIQRRTSPEESRQNRVPLRAYTLDFYHLLNDMGEQIDDNPRRAAVEYYYTRGAKVGDYRVVTVIDPEGNYVGVHQFTELPDANKLDALIVAAFSTNPR